MTLGRLNALVRAVLACAVLLLAGSACASEVVDVLPLTERIIVVHFDDGHVVHHQAGHPRDDEHVVSDPLDTAAASRPKTYSVASADDPAYSAARQPADVGRKSKGTDFSWRVDRWVEGRGVLTIDNYAAEHWLYLFLPAPMARGCTYVVRTGELATNGAEWKLTFDERTARSEAVHVNVLGYVPGAPEKYAYAYHWMGDKGPLDLNGYAGRAFHLIDQATGKSAFDGKLIFRMPATNRETGQDADAPPDGNFLRADVYECDFSAFQKPGTYIVAIDGIGCSFPFRIDADVYREAFHTVAKGIYHQRSGIALTEPYTDFPRPAPHNPKLTPGFAGKLLYTTVRFTEWGGPQGDPRGDPEVLLAHVKGPVDSCTWYQDAGDWDSYYRHLGVPQVLLFAYEMAPKNFSDRELNIPESGDGMPDILDEAAWLPRFCYSLRHELMEKGYGTGGVGLRVTGDGFGPELKKLPDGRSVGMGSWQDVDRVWMVSGEDPWSTYGYAGVAAHLAYCLQLAGVRDAGGVDWQKEAVESYSWAERNTRPGDEQSPESLRVLRGYAAAALFRLTGQKTYEERFAADTADVTTSTYLTWERRFAPMLYALGGGKMQRDPVLLARIRAAVLYTADQTAVVTPSRRALRWGGNWYMPMLNGQQTTPWVLEGAVGYTLTRTSDPAKARRYLAALYTTCDFFLGTNSLNMTWVTGLGPRHPDWVMSLDAWYNGKGQIHPGIVPNGPRRKVKDLGMSPADPDWPNATLYPPVDQWPGNERWYNNGCSPATGEFTISYNLAPTAAIFGYLCAPGPEAGAGERESR